VSPSDLQKILAVWPAERDLDLRFFAMVQVTDSCWLWLGSKDAKGYGRVSRNDYPILCTRYILGEFNGTPVPDELEACHSCNTPSCIHPKHLYQAPHAINMADAGRDGLMASGPHHYQSTKTCCPNCGGPYSLNTYGKRICKPCRAILNAGYHERRRFKEKKRNG